MKKFAAASADLFAMLLISGCSFTAPPPEPSPASLEIGSADTIDAVKDAFIAAGGTCDWTQTDRVSAAIASGECSEKTVISLYASQADVDEAVAVLQSIAIRDLTLLVGENWIINSAEAEAMQDKLGGRWVTERATPSPEPDKPEAGSLSDPLPPGFVATVTAGGEDAYSVSVALVDGDAWPAIEAANQFNDPPAVGQKYIIIAYTFTGLGSDPVVPGVERFNFAVATPDGRVFQEASAVLPGSELSDSPDLYNGQSFTGNAAYLVPADSSSWLVTAFGVYLQL